MQNWPLVDEYYFAIILRDQPIELICIVPSSYNRVRTPPPPHPLNLNYFIFTFDKLIHSSFVG